MLFLFKNSAIQKAWLVDRGIAGCVQGGGGGGETSCQQNKLVLKVNVRNVHIRDTIFTESLFMILSMIQEYPYQCPRGFHHISLVYNAT